MISLIRYNKISLLQTYLLVCSLMMSDINQFFTKLIYELFSVFNDATEAIQKIPILKPDIVLTDLDMPNVNGLELIQRLRTTLNTKFVLLTMHINQAVMKKVVELDLDGYLPKNTDEFEFFQCLQTIVAGRKYYSQKAVATLNQKSNQLTNTGIKLTQSLTERETEILRPLH